MSRWEGKKNYFRSPFSQNAGSVLGRNKETRPLCRAPGQWGCVSEEGTPARWCGGHRRDRWEEQGFLNGPGVTDNHRPLFCSAPCSGLTLASGAQLWQG